MIEALPYICCSLITALFPIYCHESAFSGHAFKYINLCKMCSLSLSLLDFFCFHQILRSSDSQSQRVGSMFSTISLFYDRPLTPAFYLMYVCLSSYDYLFCVYKNV